ncbi:hypothetical protein GE061_009734 [Apolygus lucorum]|uniref:Major facilitator superfamily (MFS) profile domain-containing protein n=1 Tax=Apolygus lucorum TaxID=248454 RepID=A0A6A4JTE1_APOLU|nr:hypothetical protein GE061_009734 [Apolygus lucorum]
MFEKVISFGPYGQWIAAIATTFSVALSGSIVAWPSAAFPKMVDGSAGFDFTDTEKSWLASLPFAGAVFSPIPVSYIMDRLGRRNTLHVSILLAMLHWIVVAFSSDFYFISVARFMSGLFCGTEYISVSILVAEMVEPSIRGRLISVTGMTFYMGALYVSCISYASYQTMTLLCGVPALLLFITFMFIPESPYYYLMHGKRKEAEDAVVWLRGHCNKEEFKRIEDGVQEQLKSQGTFKEIISFKPNRNAFILIECFKIFSSCTACLILFSYSTSLVPDSFVSSQDSYILLCILWVFAALVSSSVMDKFPRRMILGVSCVGTFSFYAITTIWYYLKEFTTVDLSSTTWIPLVSILFGSFFEIIGIVNIPNVLKGEIFPINIKTKACALSCMTACGLETLNALFYYDLNNLIGQYINFLKPCISCCLCLYITVFHMFETKGLDLETIQDMLTGKNRGKKTENEKVSYA